MILRKGTIKRIHVFQAGIRENKKLLAIKGSGGLHHVMIVQTSKGPVRGTSVKIKGPSEMVYSPTKPLSCGATVWIETRAEVEVIDPVGLSVV